MSTPTSPDPATDVPATPMAAEKYGPVLVAVDGSPASEHALNWATVESIARNVPLKIVSVYGWDHTLDPFGFIFHWNTALDEAVENIELARAHVSTIAPQVQSTGHAVFGQVPASVLKQAHGASLIVIGRASRRRPSRWRASLASKLSRRSTIPVVVVGQVNPGAAGSAPGQVMLALDGPGAHADAVTAGFRAAARRQTGLVVTHAWRRPPHSEIDAALAASLEDWQARLPDVALTQRFLLTAPGCSLTLDASGAALLIVSESDGGAGRGPAWFRPGPATTISCLGDHTPGTVILMPPPPRAAHEVARSWASLVEIV